MCYPACKAHGPCYHLWPLWLHCIFRHYFINGTIFGKKVLKIKRVCLFSLNTLSKKFLILINIQRLNVINVKSSCKVPVVLVRFELNFKFFDRFSKKKAQISNFMKILPVGAEFFMRTDGQTDMKQKVAFRNFENAPNNTIPLFEWVPCRKSIYICGPQSRSESGTEDNFRYQHLRADVNPH